MPTIWRPFSNSCTVERYTCPRNPSALSSKQPNAFKYATYFISFEIIALNSSHVSRTRARTLHSFGERPFFFIFSLYFLFLAAINEQKFLFLERRREAVSLLPLKERGNILCFNIALFLKTFWLSFFFLSKITLLTLDDNIHDIKDKMFIAFRNLEI